jgi:hypothetical protein
LFYGKINCEEKLKEFPVFTEMQAILEVFPEKFNLKARKSRAILRRHKIPRKAKQFSKKREKIEAKARNKKESRMLVAITLIGQAIC